MADNVSTQSATLATVPAATSIATDQLVSGDHVQFVKLMDGTLDGTTKATVGAAGLKVDGSGAAIPVTDNAGSLTVDPNTGTVWDVSDRGARLLGVISGTVTANVGTTNGLALDATLTGGTAKEIIRGGAKGTSVAADITSTPSGLNHQAADVALYDAAGNLIDPRDVSDRAARLLGVVSGGANVFHMDDNAGSVTVDAPVATPVFARLSDGAAALVGQKAMAASLPVALASDQTTLPAVTEQRAAPLAVTATGLAAAAVTLTLPLVASQFHYITEIQIVKFATALLTAGATPVLVTTTNLPGSPVFSFSAAASAAGTNEVQQFQPTTPLKSSVAGTATTIVCPATTATIWRVNVFYSAAL